MILLHSAHRRRILARLALAARQSDTPDLAVTTPALDRPTRRDLWRLARIIAQVEQFAPESFESRAGILARLALDAATTGAALVAAFDDWVRDHFDQREAETIRRALLDTDPLGPEPTDGGIRLFTPAEVINRRPPAFVVGGMLGEDSLAALVGPPGSGKSFVALDLALSVAAGRPFLGRQVWPGWTIYISGEGSAGLGARIRAWQVARGVADVNALAHCRFVTVAPQVTNAEHRAALLAAVRALPERPRLIAVDTLARTALGLDENAARDMGEYVAGLDSIRTESGAAVLVLHHIAKNGNGGPRGSSALHGALDSLFAVKADGRNVSLECLKQKDTEEFAEIALQRRRIELGNGESSLVFDRTESAPLALGGMDLQVLAALVDCFGTDGATSARWRAVCNTVSDMAFYRAIKNLVSDGYVTKPEGKKRGAMYFATQEAIREVESAQRAGARGGVP